MRLDEFIRNCLPPAVALAVERAERRTLYELRLRADRPVQWIGSESGWLSGSGRLLPTPDGALVTSRAMLEETLFRATGRSMQSAMDSICKGFLPLPGGGRLGVAGTASTADGQVLAVHTISALCFRFPGDFPHAADRLLDQMTFPSSLLIAGPPMSGKTTVLRALIGKLAQGMRLAVLDERGELTPLPEGAVSADLLTGYPKAEAMLLAVRSLSPELMICDELSPQEAGAVSASLYSGVPLVATVHAGSISELLRREWTGKLLREGAFEKVVLLEGRGRMGALLDGYALGATGSRYLPDPVRSGCGDTGVGEAGRKGAAAEWDGAVVRAAGRTADPAAADRCDYRNADRRRAFAGG